MNLFPNLLIGHCAINQRVAPDNILLVAHSNDQCAVREPRRDKLSGIARPFRRSRRTRLGRL
ncbi:MAG: hypothetical protein WCC97_12165 [Candidatus Acidiferrales bacterium]